MIEIDRERVGVLTVLDCPDALFLDLLEIVPAWQGRGLGSAILISLLERAGALGLPLTLKVLRANPRARGLYERHGLSVTDDSDPVRVWMST